MFNLQGSEIIVILILALVVLGPEKLPNAIRQFTKTYAELKKMGNGFQTELKSALDEPMREMRETASLVRDAVDPSKFVAEAEAERRLEHTAATEAASPVAVAPEPTPWPLTRPTGAATPAFGSPLPPESRTTAMSPPPPPPPPPPAAAAAAAVAPPAPTASPVVVPPSRRQRAEGSKS